MARGSQERKGGKGRGGRVDSRPVVGHGGHLPGPESSEPFPSPGPIALLSPSRPLCAGARRSDRPLHRGGNSSFAQPPAPQAPPGKKRRLSLPSAGPGPYARSPHSPARPPTPPTQGPLQPPKPGNSRRRQSKCACAGTWHYVAARRAQAKGGRRRRGARSAYPSPPTAHAPPPWADTPPAPPPAGRSRRPRRPRGPSAGPAAVGDPGGGSWLAGSLAVAEGASPPAVESGVLLCWVDSGIVLRPTLQHLTLCSKEMVMEKPSPLLVGREFVRQYYTLLNKAPEYLHRFYGRNSSYVHGGVDASGKPQEAVYGQNDIHHKVLSLNFSECHTKIRHVDAHATLSDGVVVQVMGLLSNSGQPERKFMQTFVLAPEGSVPNKFYVHNDMFRYEDEVFGDSEPELDEESEDEVEEEQEERQPSPEPVQENADSGYYEAHPVANGIEEPLEESSHEPEPEPDSETKTEELKPQVEEKNLEELEEKSTSPPPAEPVSLPQEPPKPRVEAKPEVQSQPPRVREQRPRERPGFPPRGPRPGRGDLEQNESDNRRIIRYPDSHQLFVGNLPHDIDENELKEFFMSFGNVVELRINTKGVGGKLPNFGFVVFDDSEPVQRILIAKPIMFRGEVRLNVEEKKTRAARERETRGGGDDRRDIRRNDRGPGGPRGIVGGGMMRDRDGRGPPPRGGMAQKLGSGRGTGQMEGRFTGQRR
uniref:Ras GTPase-activating protein-binding protein 2 n=5 Tax=Canidae TaxID=9608 RepID=A0A8C0NK01_CANLF